MCTAYQWNKGIQNEAREKASKMGGRFNGSAVCKNGQKYQKNAITRARTVNVFLQRSVSFSCQRINTLNVVHYLLLFPSCFCALLEANGSANAMGLVLFPFWRTRIIRNKFTDISSNICLLVVKKMTSIRWSFWYILCDSIWSLNTFRKRQFLCHKCVKIWC